MSAVAKKVDNRPLVTLPDAFLLRPDLPWYVVIAQPSSEILAARELANQRYETWLPMCRQDRRSDLRGRLIDPELPLFPRYLFVGIPDGMASGPIMSTRGVVDMVRGESRFPTRIPLPVLEALHRRLAASGGMLDFRKPRYQKDERLRVTSGPFVGFEGLFVRSKRQRIELLLEIMGRQSRVWIDDGQAERTIPGGRHGADNTAS